MGEDGPFIKIRLASLLLDTVTKFDLYLKPQGREDFVLYRQQDLPFTGDVKTRLEENNVRELYVPSTQEDLYHDYIEANLALLVKDDSIDLAEKSGILYDAARHVVKEVMQDPRSGNLVPRSENIVNNFIVHLFEEEQSFSQFLKTTSFDYYTYTHSVNVFVFSLNLAQRLGYDDEASLKELGMGALLHDLGKSRISAEIIHCKGVLTDEQWHTMKQHPRWGHEILQEQGITSETALDVTLHHHEKFRGAGYPEGLKTEQISPQVRIVTICDIFDALTTRRAYKDALNSFPALGLMQREMGADLDPEFFRFFIKMMASSVESGATLKKA